MEKAKTAALQIRTLSIFRGLFENPVIGAFQRLLETLGTETEAENYCRFINLLYFENPDFSRFLFGAVLENENSYILKKAHGKDISECETQCLKNELAILQNLSEITSKDITGCMDKNLTMPGGWENSHIDFTAEYLKRLSLINIYGYGIYAKYSTFSFKDGALAPVKNPDPIMLSDLSGYTRERQLVIDNTAALLAGKPAANVLLYGDAGTGKSSTVKAVANEFRDKGLRLIEMTKRQLHELPSVLDSLSANPLKFILFIDDLSFTGDDDDFGALKAVLEGSVSSKSHNLVIYATSNRRHLVKESFSDREGDDIHHNDTIEELISLSARFGLSVTFQRPEKKDYISIVKDIAAQYHVNMPEQQLITAAEAFALRKGGRSPRVARQFIESVVAAVE